MNQSFRDEKGYTLYVGDVPTNLTEDGLRTIFGDFGKIEHVLRFPAENYAFVSFGTFGEAQKAILEVNRKPPLNLKVEFGIHKQNNNHEDEIETIPMVSTEYDHRCIPSQFRTTKSRPKPQDLVERMPIQISATDYGYTAGGYIPLNADLYDPYDELEHKNVVGLWSRGIVTIDRAGRRHVTAGRGFTMYHLPEPNPRVERDIHFVYEARNRDKYVYGVDEVKDKVGKCILCQKTATNNCASCLAFYCSRDCQISDWPKHQTICKVIPSLIKNDNASTSNISNKSSTMNNKGVNNNNQNGETISNHDNSEKKSDISKRLEKCRISAQQTDNDAIYYIKKPFLPEGEYVEVQISVIHEPGLMSVQKTSDLPKLSEIMADLNASNLDLIPLNLPDLVKGRMYGAFFKGLWHRINILSITPSVKVQYSDYGNIETVAKPDFRDIGKLKEIPPLADIIKIVSDTDNYKHLSKNIVIKVKLINIESNGVHNVELLMDKLIASHSESIEPTVAASLPTKTSETIQAPPRPPKVASIIPKKDETLAASQPENVRKPVSAPKAEAIPVPKPTPALVSQIATIPSCLELIPNVQSQPVIVTISEPIDQNSALGTLIFDAVSQQFNDLFVPLAEACEANQSKFANYRPKLNELICTKKSDGGWYRGRIIGLNPLKMASLDEGLIIETVNVIPVPENFRKTCNFGILLKSNNVSFKKDMVFTAVVKTKKIVNGEPIVNITLTDGELKNTDLELTKWNPIGEMAPQQYKALQNFEIKNGSKVVIVSHRGSTIVFIRSVDTQENERYHKLIQSVAKEGLTAPGLTSMPSSGDLVLAKFIDDNFYRAIVLNIVEDKIKIAYLDYGNNEVTTLDKLRVMSEDLKNEPRASIKAELKGINKEIAPTVAINDFIDALVAKEDEFICKFDNSIKEGVVLTNKTGCLNDSINEFLNDSYKTDNVEKDADERLTLASIEPANIGKTGDTVKIILMETIKDGLQYAIAPIDAQAVTYICEDLTKLLRTYADSTQHYIPVINELCVAKFDGEWYRACCINNSSTPTTATLFFIDFGNIADIPHVDIRQMVVDFLKPPALSTVVSVIDFLPRGDASPPPVLIAKLKELLVQNLEYEVKIVHHDAETEETTVEFPEIRKILEKEGLL